MPRRIAAVLLPLLLTSAAACHQPMMTPLKSKGEITADYDAKIADVREHALSEFYWPICEVPPKKGKDCGLIADRLVTKEAVADYVTGVCHETMETLSDDCRSSFRGALFGEVKKRYARASEQDVQRACESTPEKCDTFAKVELLFLSSHNDAVIAEAKSKIADLVAEHDREQTTTQRARDTRAEQEEDRRRAWGAVAAGLQGAAQGMSNAIPERNSSAVRSVETAKQCSSDYDCGGPGYVCSKPVGSFQGECARSVNRFGNQEFTSPRTNSLGPGQRQCWTMSDCGIGFSCDQGRCLKQ